jgi:NAD(P)H-dependent FMN reductase
MSNVSSTKKVLAFAGSARAGSWNKKLVQVAAQGAEKAGAEVTYVDLRDYPMPVFDEDYEAEHGAPESVVKFKQLMKDADGFLISSPENNAYFSALLKNVVDWASRRAEGEEAKACFLGKKAMFMAASPGGLGGVRGLPHVQNLFFGMGTTVLPGARAIGGIHTKFNEDGSMNDEKLQADIEGLGATLVESL